MTCRTAVLISGRGSNLAALLAAAADPGCPFSIDLVLSNRASAAGLASARAAGVATRVLGNSSQPDRNSYDQALARLLREARVDLVVLAGFMRILSSDFVLAHQQRMLNIHPSLLPRHPGLDTHQRALAAADQVHGATVHFVTPEVDGGPRVAQVQMPVLADDTATSLAARVLTSEHRLLPAAVAWFADGHLQMAGDKVLFDGIALPGSGVLFRASADSPGILTRKRGPDAARLLTPG